MMGKLMLVWLALGLLLYSSHAAVSQQQYVVMVWDARCIKSLVITPATHIEAPMKDGRPDFSKAVIVGTDASVDISCGHSEVRRVK